MKKNLKSFINLLSLVFIFCWNVEALAQNWSVGYYPGWQQYRMPASEVDFNTLSHVMHFALVPRVDGSLDSTSNSVTYANGQGLLAGANSKGKKVLISIGGWNSASGFRGATNSTNLPRFVANIISFVRSNGYHGVDLDWEPLETTDSVQFSNLVRLLRAELDKQTPRPLLTVAVGVGQQRIVAPLASYFDQINIMTYDMAFTWTGVSAHHAGLHDGGIKDQWGNPISSLANTLSAFVSAGIPKSKLGVGIAFYGYKWSGVSAPGQTWTTTPQITALSYVDIMESHHSTSSYRWDALAKAPYLSVDSTGTGSDSFITYENDISAQEKIKYIKANAVGGFIIWELGQAYFPTAPLSARQPLLNSIKNAMGGTTPTPPAPVDAIVPSVTISAPLTNTLVGRLTVVSVRSSATDNVAVARKEIFVNGTRICTVTTASATCSFKTAGQSGLIYRIIARSYDAANNVGTSATITVRTR